MYFCETQRDGRKRELSVNHSSQKTEKNQGNVPSSHLVKWFKEKRSIYGQNWGQLSLSAESSYAMIYLTKQGSASTIFFYLLSKADRKNEITIKQAQICAVLKICDKSVRNGLKFLIDNAFICVIKDKKENTYIINPDIIWKSWGKNLKYCRFQTDKELPKPPAGSPEAKDIAKAKRKEALRKQRKERLEELEALKQKEVSYSDLYPSVPLPDNGEDEKEDTSTAATTAPTPEPIPKKKTTPKPREERHIPDETIKRVKQAADIVKVAERYIKLKRCGANYMGLCPYHNETSPSFCVSPSRQSFKCFGCDTCGDVFKLVMDFERVDFVGAVKILADWFNVIVDVA